MDKLHSLFTTADGIHIIQAWSLATYAERASLSGDLVPADVGRVAFVAEDLSFWVLADDNTGEGPLWVKLSFSIEAASTVQPVGSANVPGVSTAYAREDHVHSASSKADAVFTIRAHTGTTDTLVLADAGKLITSSNAGAVTQTIPSNATVAIPVGSSIQFVQLGAGQLTLSCADTLRVPPGFLATPKTRGQYSLITATKIASTTWLVSGDLAYV
jgi:hypothetical protein